MSNITIPASVQRALRPLMTRRVACGAAAALAVGIGLGAWLQPPQPHYGAQTVINPPQEQPNLWGEEASATSSLPFTEPATSPAVYQTASLSPPAGGGAADAAGTMQLAQADPRQVAASGDTSHAAADPPQARPTQVTYTQPAPLNVPAPQPPRPAQPQAPPEPPRAQGRDWASYDARNRGARYGGQAQDDDEDQPPPPRWDRPPERRMYLPPERRWDFRREGSAAPIGDEDDGG